MNFNAESHKSIIFAYHVDPFVCHVRQCIVFFSLNVVICKITYTFMTAAYVLHTLTFARLMWCDLPHDSHLCSTSSFFIARREWISIKKVSHSSTYVKKQEKTN